MQKLVRNKIMNYLTTNNLITENQFGFLKGKSCQLQLLESLEDWTSALDSGSDVDIIFYDCKKAFDTLSHSKLLQKLESYGIIGHTKDWIENLLKDRSQEVVINNSHSSSKTVLSGVPQGSVLGPTLFLIYINDLPEVADTTVKLFADDTKTYNVITKVEDQTKLQSTTDKFLKWSRKWSLEFNEKNAKDSILEKNSLIINISWKQNSVEVKFQM